MKVKIGLKLWSNDGPKTVEGEGGEEHCLKEVEHLVGYIRSETLGRKKKANKAKCVCRKS